jgi:hypothetical protein
MVISASWGSKLKPQKIPATRGAPKISAPQLGGCPARTAETFRHSKLGSRRPAVPYLQGGSAEFGWGWRSPAADGA